MKDSILLYVIVALIIPLRLCAVCSFELSWWRLDTLYPLALTSLKGL